MPEYVNDRNIREYVKETEVYMPEYVNEIIVT
jgi:hypothetical protein